MGRNRECSPRSGAHGNVAIGPAFPVRCDAAEWQGRSRPAIPALWGKLTFIAERRRACALGHSERVRERLVSAHRSDGASEEQDQMTRLATFVLAALLFAPMVYVALNQAAQIVASATLTFQSLT